MNDSTESEPMEIESKENESIEKIIESLPLRTPSNSCDQNVLAVIRGERNGAILPANQVPNATDSRPTPVAKSQPDSRSPSSKFLVATAAALLIGFCLGTMVKLNLNNGDGENSMNEPDKANSSPAGFGLSENVRVKNGESQTFIVGDSLQFQNDVPVRKVETVTRKKVLLKNKNGESEREIEIPIRKVFLTPAETI